MSKRGTGPNEPSLRNGGGGPTVVTVGTCVGSSPLRPSVALTATLHSTPQPRFYGCCLVCFLLPFPFP